MVTSQYRYLMRLLVELLRICHRCPSTSTNKGRAVDMEHIKRTNEHIGKQGTWGSVGQSQSMLLVESLQLVISM